MNMAGACQQNGNHDRRRRIKPAKPYFLTNRYLCVQRSRTLRAMNPMDGQTLWDRQDVPLASTIFGDDEYVFVLPPDKPEAMVLSGVGRRTARHAEDRTPRNQANSGRTARQYTTLRSA